MEIYLKSKEDGVASRCTRQITYNFCQFYLNKAENFKIQNAFKSFTFFVKKENEIEIREGCEDRKARK